MPFWLSLLVAAIAFAISAAIGIVLIPFLKKLHFGQTILDIGPAWHKSKQGTPIMGGFMFIFGSIIATCAGFAIFKSYSADIGFNDDNATYKLLAGILMALLFSAIGFADDYIKAVKKRNLGLSSKQKLVFQFLIAALYLMILYALGDRSMTVALPFVGALNLGYFYYPLMLLFIVFMVNAVNLTDGIDGLCGSVTTVAALALMIISVILAEHEQAIFSMAIAGGCVGFLIWNLHPAKVFMGDTGSMFLGGAIVSIGMATRQHLLLALVGIVYVCEALSVVIQVIGFKTTGKRIFKMSPIHHHFELCKWGEYKIVIIFTLVTAVAGIIAVAIAS